MKLLQAGIATIPFLLLLPLSVLSQQTSEPPAQQQETQQKAESPSTTEQQRAAPFEQRQQPQRPQAQQEGQKEAKISVMSFADSKVVDEQGKEIGEVKDILIDSQAGRIHAVNVEMTGGRGGGIFGGRQQGQLISVPWEAVTPKEKDGQLVLALEHQVIEKAQRPEPKREPEREKQRQEQGKAKQQGSAAQ